MPIPPDAYEPIDQLKELVTEAEQYEKQGREIIALSNKIQHTAKDLVSKMRKIGKIKTSSLYQNLKYITKKQKDYVNWAIKDAYDNITKKKKYTSALNPSIDRLNQLLQERDNKVLELNRMTRRRVTNLEDDALLTREESILNNPRPATIRIHEDWKVTNFNNPD